jgi:hypothetical protein
MSFGAGYGNRSGQTGGPFRREEEDAAEQTFEFQRLTGNELGTWPPLAPPPAAPPQAAWPADTQASQAVAAALNTHATLAGGLADAIRRITIVDKSSH